MLTKYSFPTTISAVCVKTSGRTNMRLITALLAAAALWAMNTAHAQKWDMPTPYSDNEFHTLNVKRFVRGCQTRDRLASLTSLCMRTAR
jgi:hypothetical protein